MWNVWQMPETLRLRLLHHPFPSMCTQLCFWVMENVVSPPRLSLAGEMESCSSRWWGHLEPPCSDTMGAIPGMPVTCKNGFSLWKIHQWVLEICQKTNQINRYINNSPMEHQRNSSEFEREDTLQGSEPLVQIFARCKAQNCATSQMWQLRGRVWFNHGCM